MASNMFSCGSCKKKGPLTELIDNLEGDDKEFLQNKANLIAP